MCSSSTSACLCFFCTAHCQVPVVVTEQERKSTHQTAERHDASAEVCGQKTFTEVEDRPVVRERVERVVEHRPVEKQVGGVAASCLVANGSTHSCYMNVKFTPWRLPVDGCCACHGRCTYVSRATRPCGNQPLCGRKE